MDAAKADEPGSADDREILETAKMVSPAFEVLYVRVMHASLVSVHLQHVCAAAGASAAWRAIQRRDLWGLGLWFRL
jgi:hypothetical protein